MAWRGPLQVRVTLPTADPMATPNHQMLGDDLLELTLRWSTDAPIARGKRALPAGATGTMRLSGHDNRYDLDSDGDGAEYLPPRQCRIWQGRSDGLTYIWDGWTQMRPCGATQGPGEPVEFCLFDRNAFDANTVVNYDLVTPATVSSVLTDWTTRGITAALPAAAKPGLLVDAKRVTIPPYNIGPIEHESTPVDFVRSLSALIDGWCWYDKNGLLGIREYDAAKAQAKKATKSEAEQLLDVLATDSIIHDWREMPLPAQIENRIQPFSTVIQTARRSWAQGAIFTQTPTASLPSGVVWELTADFTLPMNAVANTGFATWSTGHLRDTMANSRTQDFVSVIDDDSPDTTAIAAGAANPALTAMQAFFTPSATVVREQFTHVSDRVIRYRLQAIPGSGHVEGVVPLYGPPVSAPRTIVVKGLYTIRTGESSVAPGTAHFVPDSQAIWGVRESPRPPWFDQASIGTGANQRDVNTEVRRRSSVNSTDKMILWAAPLWQNTAARSQDYANQIGAGTQHTLQLPGRPGPPVPVITLAQELRYRVNQVPVMLYWSFVLE